MIIAFSARSEGLKPLEIAEREYCTSNTIHGLGDGDVNTCLDLSVDSCLNKYTTRGGNNPLITKTHEHLILQ